MYDRTHRLIPASAGNSRPSIVRGPRPSAHPRERGELLVGMNRAEQLRGSSPRARGTPREGLGARGVDGLIPASAGNSTLRPGRSVRHGAHPRERGELVSRRFSSMRSRGSSPRARGTRCRSFRILVRQGLIPASAGNSSGRYRPSRGTAAHPRERGELRARPARWSGPLGSSPRARGTHQASWTAVAEYGLIPASAGNSPKGVRRQIGPGAHPRERGELPAWGGVLPQCGGLIPASAGNSHAPI